MPKDTTKPKTKTKAKAKAAKSSPLAVPRPSQAEKHGKGHKKTVASKSQPKPPTSPPLQLKPTRAVVIKAVKTPAHLPSPRVESGVEGEVHDEYFPDDGMDGLSSADSDDAGFQQVLEFVTDLGNESGEEDDQSSEDDDADVVVHRSPGFRSTQRKRPDFAMTTSTPVRIRGGKNPREPVHAPVTPTRGGSGTVVRMTSSATDADYTPYRNHINPRDPSKPLLTMQSPISRSIQKLAQQLYRADIITKKAFPEDDERVELAAKFILKAAHQLGASRRIARFQDDRVYQDNMTKMTKKGDTAVRSTTAAAAREITGPAFGLGPGIGSPQQNKSYVDMLLADGNFIYRVLESEELADGTFHRTARSGPYRNALIATLIQQEFFTKHDQMAVAEATSAVFNPIPIPVIAIAATAIQCALQDWKTGVRVQSTSEFSADEWATTYEQHMRELERIQELKAREFDMWTRKLWKDCWSTTRQSLANIAGAESFISVAELDDFADVENAV